VSRAAKKSRAEHDAEHDVGRDVSGNVVRVGPIPIPRAEPLGGLDALDLYYAARDLARDSDDTAGPGIAGSLTQQHGSAALLTAAVEAFGLPSLVVAKAFDHGLLCVHTLGPEGSALSDGVSAAVARVESLPLANEDAESVRCSIMILVVGGTDALHAYDVMACLARWCRGDRELLERVTWRAIRYLALVRAGLIEGAADDEDAA
jgi:hypothetical protein